MATVDKNFKVKHGLIVEGTTATVNGEDIITTGSTTDNLPEGSTNVYYTEGRAKTDAAELLTGATLTNITITGDGSGLTITAENGGIQDISGFDTDDLTEGATNLYFTNQRALDATASAYDVAGAASSAQTAAQSYADGLAVNYDPAGSASAAQTAAESYADGLAVNYDPAGSASTAETNANSYTDTALGSYTTTANLDTTVGGYGYIKTADLTGYATETYVNTAVDNLVDGAPGLLDTLNEIAAAINDDANYATTMTTALAGKQNELTAGTNISIVSDTISVTGLASTDISDFSTAALSATASAYDAAGAAASAQSAAESYADGLASNYDAAGTASGLVDDLKDGTTAFTAVNINSLAKQVAATSSSLGSVVVTAYSFAKAAYKTAKFLVKIDNGTENEVSEILLTLDSSDNIAITEYAIVSTNGSRGTITADISGSDVRLRVNPVNDSTINVVGTLLA